MPTELEFPAVISLRELLDHLNLDSLPQITFENKHSPYDKIDREFARAGKTYDLEHCDKGITVTSSLNGFQILGKHHILRGIVIHNGGSATEPTRVSLEELIQHHDAPGGSKQIVNPSAQKALALMDAFKTAMETGYAAGTPKNPYDLELPNSQKRQKRPFVTF